MARKTEEERLLELEAKIEQMKAKKQQVASKLREKERKERTRRLIEIGAIFENYFELKGENEPVKKAEKVAFGLNNYVKKHKDKLFRIDLEKSKEANEIVYEEPEERIIVPEGETAPYETSKP